MPTAPNAASRQTHRRATLAVAQSVGCSLQPLTGPAACYQQATHLPLRQAKANRKVLDLKRVHRCDPKPLAENFRHWFSAHGDTNAFTPPNRHISVNTTISR